MKTILLLVGLLASIFSFAQTPFIHYFGATGRLHHLEDFTRSNNDNYLLHAYGNYNAHLDHDMLIYQYAVADGLQDSIISIQPGNQLLFSAEEDGNGGAIVCSHTRLPNKALDDILIRYLDADGNEIDDVVFGEESREILQQTALDEQQNYFVAYSRGVSVYTRLISYYTTHLRMINADHETIYDIEIDLPNGRIFDLITLGNGEIIVIAINDTPMVSDQAEIIKISADGTFLWRRGFNNMEHDILYLSQGYYDGEELYLADYLSKKILTLDITSGNLTGAFSYPEEVFGDFFFPFVKVGDDLWIFTQAYIYHLTPNAGTFDLVESHLINAGEVTRARFRPEGAWEYLNTEGTLSSFNLNTTEISTMGQIEIGESYTASETTSNVMLVDDQIYAGVSRFQDVRSSIVMNRFSADAHLVSSVATEPMSFYRAHQMAMLPNGGAATLAINLNEEDLFELKLNIYDEDGEIVSENILIENSSPSIIFSKILVFEDGDIGVYFSLIDFGTYDRFLYKINPENPVVVPLLTSVDNRLYGGFSNLQDGNVGLSSVSLGTNQVAVSLQKIKLTSGVIWEANNIFAELQNTRAYNSSGVTMVGSTNGELLFGFNLQTEDQLPVYHLKIFDDLGNDIQDFISINPYLSARASFLNNEQLIIVGCDYNLLSTGPEDVYTLRYEVYDRMGNLISEVNNDLPYELAISGLEILNDEFIAVYGRVQQDADRDAFVILMNQAGEVTSIFPQGDPTWGNLTVGPNPSNNLLHIQLDNEYHGIIEINVYSTTGHLTKKWSTNKTENRMIWEKTLAGIPNGNYWVQLKSQEGQVTTTWIKQ